jgi:transcriptional regulator with XRE-family HTH domain
MAKSLQATRYRSLPPTLRQMREAAGLTQRELAKKLKLSHTMVHNSEVAERRVDVMEFADWCVACGVDPVGALRELLKRRG